MIISPALRGYSFKQNKKYCLVEKNSISKAEMDLFQDLLNSEDCFGIFRPLSEGFSYKIATKKIADIFNLLKKRLSFSFIKKAFKLKVNELELLLCNLIENSLLVLDVGSKSYSGNEAFSKLYKLHSFEKNTTNSIVSKLSFQAVYYGYNLNENRVQDLAAKLYHFNTLPSTGERLKLFKSKSTSEIFNLKQIFGDEFLKYFNMNENEYWLYFSVKKVYGQVSANNTYKLYVSPQPEFFRECCEVLAKFIPESTSFSFKLGVGLQGILRPDKIVVYFSSKNEMLAFAKKLIKNMDDIKAQAIPFTVQLDRKGLISWGVDPPRIKTNIFWEQSSWRVWLTSKIAHYIIQYKNSKVENLTIEEYIKHKLSWDNINSNTMEPGRGFSFLNS